MGVAASSLSGTLKSLENSLGVRLFDRTAKGLLLTASGRWLYRESLNILNAESLAGLFVGSHATKVRVISLRIDLDFTIGKIAIAVGKAITAVQAEFTNVFFNVYWIKESKNAEKQAAKQQPDSVIDLRYFGPDLNRASREIHRIGTECLVLARLAEHRGAFAGNTKSPVIVPRMPGVLHRSLDRFLAAEKSIEPIDLFFADEVVASLQKLVTERPDATFLLPSTAVSSRLGLIKLSDNRRGKESGVPIVAVIDSEDSTARAFVDRLCGLLADDHIDQVYRPRTTLRQLSYFELLRQARSVTGAARLAAVAQPAVTEQLAKLEKTLGCKLFDRSRKGLELTRSGLRFAQAVGFVTGALSELKVKRPQAVDLAGGRIELGILPSVGPDGYLVSRITKAVEAWRLQHPGLNLRILEEPNAILRERITRGTLDLGIVTTRSTRMARFDLGSSEQLALIAGPDLGRLLQDGPIKFGALANLPLVLPGMQFGIRQRLDAMAGDHGITIRPVIEVDSLAMCVALVREGALCTILPPSDLTREIASGELVCRDIYPKLVRTVQIIYSTKRALTPAERDLVELLRIHLRTTAVSVARGV
jgi:DNA-binding transcriptional LysR family regulator